MNEFTAKTDQHTCKNCGHPIVESAKYCSKCGQKNTDGRISFGSFFNAFFSTVFNIESKFFKTIGHILIPGKLTIEYFKGRQIGYFHPVRLFIVSALLLIAAISTQLTGKKMNIANIYRKAETQLRNESFLAKMQIAAEQTLDKFPNNNSIKPAFDTLYHDLKGKHASDMDSVDMNTSIISNGIDKLDFKISNRDLINLKPKELADKYKLDNKLDRFIFKQKIRLIKEEGNFAPFLLGNSLWIILLMMPFLALILKLFYVRKDYFYVEHLVFSFHTHSFTFLLFAIIGFTLYLGTPLWFIAIGFLILFLYLYKALREVYRQGRFITVVKLLITIFVYFFLLVFFFAFGLLASMAIF